MQNYEDVDLWHFDCISNDTVKCKSAYWMWRSVPIILVLIGLVGNIMNFVILSRPKIRKFSTSIYLLFLAGSDIVFLFTAALNDTIYSIQGKQFADVLKLYCYIYRWLRFTSGAFSVWLLVLVTIDRYVLIKAPVFARSKLSPKVSVTVSVVLLFVIALSNTHLIYGSSYKALDETFGQSFTCDFTSEKYIQFYNGPWNIIVLIFYTVLPATIIFIGNANIAVVLFLKRKSLNRIQPSLFVTHSSGRGTISNIGSKRAQHTVTIASNGQATNSGSPRRTGDDANHTSNQSARTPNEPRQSEKGKSLTSLLFTISACFLITTLPFCVYVIFRDRLELMSKDDIDNWRLLTIIMYILLWSNFAGNFFLYFASGTHFRKELKRILSVIKGKLSRPC